jgi:flagellar hook assembly protein FlgD
MMRVRDTAGTQGIQTLTVATAKSNDVVKFPLIIDGTNPAITDASATNVVGNGSSTISYELSETALVTVTIKSGATYAKSKIIATIVNNELRTVAGAEAEGFTSTWDGKDSKGKTTPNTSATVKYWVEVRALDLAGNASANTLDVTYKEFTKSAS